MRYHLTNEDLAKADEAKTFPWDARKQPEKFEPVQLDLFQPSFFFKFVDWWNTRTHLLCCLNPCLRWAGNHELIDATDAEVWKEQVKNPSNERCPDSMKGLWWMKYNTGPENLVTIFSDADFTGTFNEEGTDGMGHWTRPLRHNWTRENAIFGLVFSVWGNKESARVEGRMNLKDGICTVHGKRGEGIQVVYRQNDDEWWKIHYSANPVSETNRSQGLSVEVESIISTFRILNFNTHIFKLISISQGEDGEQTIEYMYKWLKVLDKDGNKTKHWNEYEAWCEAPLPHRNLGTSWWPFWGWFLSGKEIASNMIRPNPKQVVNFRDVNKVHADDQSDVV